MASVEDLSVLLQNLPNSSDRMLSLTELRTALTTVSPSVLAGFVPNLSFSSLFEYLDTNDRDQIECCCVILKKLLQVVLPSVVITNFRNELLKGLKDGSQSVIELCLDQVIKVVDDDVHHVENQGEIVETIIRLLASQFTGIAVKSSSVLIKIGGRREGMQMLLGNQMLTVFSNVLKVKDIVKFRVYEVIVKIVVQSPESLKYFCNGHSDVNILSMLLSELSSENHDILGKLNALEIASQLVSCSHGYQYLEELGFLLQLERDMEQSLSEPFISIGYLKFFGCLCYMQPSLINTRLKNFTNIIFSLIINKSQDKLSIAIESLGIIASTPSGKLALNESGDAMIRCLPILGELILQPPTELRLKSLQALQHMMVLPETERSTEILMVMEKWFNHLFNQDPASQILSVCRQPFHDLELSALSVIKCLASVPWGQTVLKNTASFEEYLLDRKTETSTEGMDAKYEIVDTLICSPSAAEIFGNVYYMKLREYKKEGRYYCRSENLVAFESA